MDAGDAVAFRLRPQVNDLLIRGGGDLSNRGGAVAEQVNYDVQAEEGISLEGWNLRDVSRLPTFGAAASRRGTEKSRMSLGRNGRQWAFARQSSGRGTNRAQLVLLRPALSYGRKMLCRRGHTEMG